MSPFRRIVAASVLVLGLAGCSAPAGGAPQPVSCPPASSTDLATSEGWLARIAADPTSTGLLVDDGRGHVLAHQATTPFPLASAAKVVHLAAYGAAVAGGGVRGDR